MHDCLQYLRSTETSGVQGLGGLGEANGAANVEGFSPCTFQGSEVVVASSDNTSPLRGSCTQCPYALEYV